MTKWLILLAGLLVWAAHFFLLYGIASGFPGTSLARGLTGGVTAVALAANAGIAWYAFDAKGDGNIDPMDRWILTMAMCGGLLSFLAVAWQGLPAML